MLTGPWRWQCTCSDSYSNTTIQNPTAITGTFGNSADILVETSDNSYMTWPGLCRYSGMRHPPQTLRQRSLTTSWRWCWDHTAPIAVTPQHRLEKNNTTFLWWFYRPLQPPNLNFSSYKFVTNHQNDCNDYFSDDGRKIPIQIHDASQANNN